MERKRGASSRNNAKMMSPETVANRVFDGYTSKEILFSLFEEN